MARERLVEDTIEIGKPLPGTIRHRRVSLFRGLVIALVSWAALMLFIVWYKAWPQRMDCWRSSLRLAQALESYSRTHGKLPPVLEALETKPGRYTISHYRYRFVGFGGPAQMPDGTVIAYCSSPHSGIFHEPGRHVLIFRDGEIVINWMTEAQFQELIQSQLPVRPF